jgi:uncharacterized protein DUF72
VTLNGELKTRHCDGLSSCGFKSRAARGSVSCGRTVSTTRQSTHLWPTPSCRHSFQATGDQVYLRLHGKNRETWFKRGITPAERYKFLYSERELQSVASELRKLDRSGIKRAYVIFNNCYQNFGHHERQHDGGDASRSAGTGVSASADAGAHATRGSHVSRSIRSSTEVESRVCDFALTVPEHRSTYR